ncbi:hypothetical protein OG230_19220 [Streptomyces sp. NBC_00234]|uniref:hypothetical protein n=1 Tax=Streptomyces sp. NBC_00234 TaxID=2903638 RepID=UPI002E2D0B7C|nr:hypothetical protein [Streptomyces sp. NBC_00234]
MKAGSRTGTAAAIVGALALSVFSAPTAQAADTGITVSSVVINGGKPVVVGTSDEKAPPVTFRVALPSGYSTADPFDWQAEPFLYHGTTAAKGANSGGLYMGSYTCYDESARVARCEGEIWIDPRYDLDSNGDATTWKIGVSARLFTSNGGLKAEEYATLSGGVQVKRWAKATVNASPEPVAKGKTLTVTGSLKRADWVKHAYTGYGNQSVKLQFRKKGTSVYSTVKTVTAGSTGALKTTVTASADGYWRWAFGGTSTTGPATTSADYVDVV